MKKILLLFAIVIFILFLLILVWFIIPYSSLKSTFLKITSKNLDEVPKNNDIFTMEDLKDLPEPLQNYLIQCGYINSPKTNFIKVEMKNVDFNMDNKTLKMDCLQYNFSHNPMRFVFMDTSLYGIPFQGFDYYNGKEGGMHGVLGKAFTLFHTKGNDMDEAALATFLSEAIFLPTTLLEDYVTLESIDSTHVNATITYNGVSASGIFTFDKNGLISSFSTNHRGMSNPDGSIIPMKWTIEVDNYNHTNGIKTPQGVKAIWNLPDGDLIYFDATNVKITY